MYEVKLHCAPKFAGIRINDITKFLFQSFMVQYYDSLAAIFY